MDKLGKQSSWLIPVIIIGFLAIIGLLIFGLPQTQFGDGGKTPAGGCELDPIFDVNVFNGVNKGTAVTPSAVYASTDGGTAVNITADGSSSATKFSAGQEVEIMLSASNYIDTKIGSYTVGCGVNTIQDYLYATDDSTIKIFNDAGNVVTDNILGGTTNQSSSSTPIDMEVKLIANADQSSGDLVCVIEADNTTQVDDMILSGATKVDVPEFYTVAGAGSIAKAYTVPALLDGASKTYNLKIEPESGITIDGTGIYFTCYSSQAYVDTDGSVKVGVEDSDGTAKYEDDFDYDFLIT